MYSVVSKHCLRDVEKGFYEEFVNNLVLYAYCEEGDKYSHISLAIGALLIYFECYYMKENFKQLKTFVNSNKNIFDKNISCEIIKVRNYMLEKMPLLVEEKGLLMRLGKLSKWAVVN